MRRILIFDSKISSNDLIAEVVRFMPWLDETPTIIEEMSPTFLTAYRQAMNMSQKFICIPFHNVFKNLLMIVGKQ